MVSNTTVPKNTEIVKYDSAHGEVELSPQTIKQYLVRGNAAVTDQEVVMFMKLCEFQKLNPFTNEVYLIKYAANAPAQMVVGRDAFLRRAQENPEYVNTESGIVVLRDKEVVQKQGTCPYPSEKLIGGWCKVYKLKHDRIVEVFKEVSIEEYHKKQSTWNQIPATMIAKVAESQALRAAFPKELEGIYTHEEMLGTRPEALRKTVHNDADSIDEPDPAITQAQRKQIFALATELFEVDANDVVKAVVTELGYTSTTDLPVSLLQSVMERIEKWQPPPDQSGEGTSPQSPDTPAPAVDTVDNEKSWWQ